MKTVEEKAQEFLEDVWFIEGWRRFVAAKQISVRCMEASKDNDEMFIFYNDVFKELDNLQKNADNDKV